MDCESVCCSDNGHHADIEQMCKHVIDACLKAGDMGIPNVSVRKSKAGRKCIPGWNEFVKPAREEFMFWHWMRYWLECKKLMQERCTIACAIHEGLITV